LIHVTNAKRPEDRIRRNKPTVLNARDDYMPEPPESLPDELLDRWEDFWGSAAASLVDEESDYLVVSRLFRLYALAENAMTAIEEKEPPTANEISTMVRLSSELRMIEGALGISPRSRTALGVTAGDSGDSLDDFID
jgi:hypothetical protein